MDIKYSVILGFMGQLHDRFSSYHENKTLAGKIELVTKIQGASGVEPVYPSDLAEVSPQQFLQLLRGLSVSSVNVNIKGESKFHRGGLTSKDSGVRTEAVNYIKAGMDWAVALGANLVTVCPLADGNDYPFEMNYSNAWKWMIEGLAEAAEHRPNVKLSIEYKQSEPRHRVIVPNAGIALYLCSQVGLDNIGVTVDIGHALYVGENPAQVIALTADAGRLFLVHVNDNYRNWDWDMIPGTVNYWDWLETLLVLDEVGYKGWLVSDVFPSRLDPVDTLSACYRIIRYSDKFLDKFGRGYLRELIAKGDTIEVFDTFYRTIAGDATS